MKGEKKMPELSVLIKFSLFMMVMCPVASVLIYLSPKWKRYVEMFDRMSDKE